MAAEDFNPRLVYRRRPDYDPDPDSDADADAKPLPSRIDRVCAALSALVLNSASIMPLMTSALVTRTAMYLLYPRPATYMKVMDALVVAKGLLPATFGAVEPDAASAAFVSALKAAVPGITKVGVSLYQQSTIAQDSTTWHIKKLMHALLAKAYTDPDGPITTWKAAMSWLPTYAAQLLTGLRISAETFVAVNRQQGVFTVENAALLALLAGSVVAVARIYGYLSTDEISAYFIRRDARRALVPTLLGAGAVLAYYFAPSVIASAQQAVASALGMGARAHRMHLRKARAARYAQVTRA